MVHIPVVNLLGLFGSTGKSSGFSGNSVSSGVCQVSAEDERDRQNRIAKLRSLLFRHEMKSKHIKKIKSKTFHRLLKKDRLKAASSDYEIDPEAVKELAKKHEYERAKERMTLRHKTNSMWAKRIKERGLNAQDEGTRAAMAEQQHIHARLTRKMNSMKDTSSSEESSDEDESDEDSPGEQDRTSRLLDEAKQKTLKVLNEEDEVPNSGLLSLPFMVTFFLPLVSVLKDSAVSSVLGNCQPPGS